MIADISTIAWKEWRELFLQRGSLRGGAAGLLLMIFVFGAFLPLQTGRAWVRSPVVLLYWTWVPLLLVVSVVADSFAGERERHTLETLLASRMPDRAILFGKVLAAVGYGWGVAVTSLLLGLITVNLAHGRGELLLYPPLVALGGVGLSLLVAGLAAGAGVLVSLRAATVRQAQQTLSFATMFLVFIPIFGLQALPAAWKARLPGLLAHTSPGQVLLIVMVALALLDLGLLAAAMARFQRARLILD